MMLYNHLKNEKRWFSLTLTYLTRWKEDFQLPFLQPYNLVTRYPYFKTNLLIKNTFNHFKIVNHIRNCFHYLLTLVLHILFALYRWLQEPCIEEYQQRYQHIEIQPTALKFQNPKFLVLHCKCWRERCPLMKKVTQNYMK